MSQLRPWKKKETPQVKGRRVEKKRADEYGARLHPGSGSGRIKHDASTSEDLIELKEVAKSHTLTGTYCDKLYRIAVQQGKEALYVVNFGDVGLTAEIRLRRSKNVN